MNRSTGLIHQFPVRSPSKIDKINLLHVVCSLRKSAYNIPASAAASSSSFESVILFFALLVSAAKLNSRKRAKARIKKGKELEECRDHLDLPRCAQQKIVALHRRSTQTCTRLQFFSLTQLHPRSLFSPVRLLPQHQRTQKKQNKTNDNRTLRPIPNHFPLSQIFHSAFYAHTIIQRPSDSGVPPK